MGRNAQTELLLLSAVCAPLVTISSSGERSQNLQYLIDRWRRGSLGQRCCDHQNSWNPITKETCFVSEFSLNLRENAAPMNLLQKAGSCLAWHLSIGK